MAHGAMVTGPGLRELIRMHGVPVPQEFLIRGLAGLEILEPGCGKVRIDPYRGSDAYEVVYPTPKGDLSVKWDGAEVKVDAPEGVIVDQLQS